MGAMELMKVKALMAALRKEFRVARLEKKHAASRLEIVRAEENKLEKFATKKKRAAVHASILAQHLTKKLDQLEKRKIELLKRFRTSADKEKEAIRKLTRAKLEHSAQTRQTKAVIR